MCPLFLNIKISLPVTALQSRDMLCYWLNTYKRQKVWTWSSLNTCNQKLRGICNIPVLVSHILLLMSCTTKHKEPSNTRNPANVQAAFPAGASASHSVGLCVSVMWKARLRLTCQLMLQPSYSLDKQSLYCHFLTWISQMVHMNLAQPSHPEFLKKWHFYPWKWRVNL